MGTRHNKAPPIQPGDLVKHRAEEVRKQIQVTKLIQRAAQIAAGEIVGDPQVLGVQMRATEMLLRKALPDLSSIEMKADVDQTLKITIVKEA